MNKKERLCKNLKKRSTHLRSFPPFEDLPTAVEEGLAFYQPHPEAVKAAIGKTHEHLGDEAAQAA